MKMVARFAWQLANFALAFTGEIPDRRGGANWFGNPEAFASRFTDMIVAVRVGQKRNWQKPGNQFSPKG